MAPRTEDLQHAKAIVRSKHKFRPGQPRQYLYIAKAVGGPADEFKVGKTTRPPEQRMRGMGGQSSVQFELVTAYEVLNCTEAESWAFLQIDQKGLRKNPNTRIELVNGDLPTLQAICAQAAATSIENSLIRQRQQASVVKALGLTVLKPGHALRAPAQNRQFWLDAFAWAVQFEGQEVSLENLLAQAVSSPSARKRLNQLGLTCCAIAEDHVGFQVDWTRTPALLQHQCLMGHESPEAYQSMVKFKLLRAAPAASSSRAIH